DGKADGLDGVYQEEGYDEDLSHRALKTFEAGYDGPPEINLGDYADNEDEEAPQPFFNEDREGDAAFLDQEFDAAAVPPVKEGRGRKYMMMGSALVGALALGGAFAFAYKTGGSSGDSQPPLIQADARPAKVAPAEPGGKEFPHKNKLIYERLNGAGEPADNERLVPRQEQVAETPPALRPGEGQRQAALMPGASSAPAPQQPAAAVPAEAPEAPRKVRTLLVRPDGTLVQPTAEQPAPAQPAPAPVASAEPAPAAAPLPLPPATPAPAAAEPVRPTMLGAPAATAEPAAAPAPAAQVPPPLSKPSPPPVAVASAPPAPTPQASAGSGTYVVQVAARKSQADALAAFADLQQKYPDLLSGYRPMIQRADLGDRGVWYRLRVGPMNEKTAAADLCTKLKGAGIGSCLVREE
ncbi:MAG: SPOR domain-containing protein, partial [Hyphomicrobiales bacterium]